LMNSIRSSEQSIQWFFKHQTSLKALSLVTSES
jgi:hypothetical protein